MGTVLSNMDSLLQTGKDEELLRRLDEYAEKTGRSRAGSLRWLLTKALDQEDKQERGNA